MPNKLYVSIEINVGENDTKLIMIMFQIINFVPLQQILRGKYYLAELNLCFILLILPRVTSFISIGGKYWHQYKMFNIS